ncbi:MAG TPA: FHA domain-containing protein, partial [Polyangiaceae bacterium]|nr:FHA domain-containing protein [Polyangiaceae bacterium]
MSKPGPIDPDSTVAGDVVVLPGLRQLEKLPTLEQVKGPGAPRRFPLALPETVVGRSHQVTVTIDSALLSRRHV